MAKPAAKRVKVEKGADPEPAPTEAPAAAPVKEEKKQARPKTAAEVAHKRTNVDEKNKNRVLNFF